MSNLPPELEYSPARADSTRNCALIGCALCSLVCLGLLGLTVVYLSPRTKQFRLVGRGIICQRNLEEIGKASRMYTSDYHETMPIASQWMDLTDQYIKERRGDNPKDNLVFHCPIVQEDNPFFYGYAMNSKLSHFDLKVKKIEFPAETFLVYDSANVSQRNASDPATSLPNPGRHLKRNLRANNVVFADGHTALIAKDRSHRGETGDTNSTDQEK